MSKPPTNPKANKKQIPGPAANPSNTKGPGTSTKSAVVVGTPKSPVGIKSNATVIASPSTKLPNQVKEAKTATPLKPGPKRPNVMPGNKSIKRKTPAVSRKLNVETPSTGSPKDLVSEGKDVLPLPIEYPPEVEYAEEEGKTVTTVSTMSIFLKGWKQKVYKNTEIIPDPEMKPGLISLVTKRIYILYLFQAWMATFIFGFFFYSWSNLERTFAHQYILEIFLSRRGYATVFDMTLVPVLVSYFACMIANIPNPVKWGCRYVHLNRFSRWAFYFIFVAYMIVMVVYWIIDLTRVYDKLNTTMYNYLINDTVFDNGSTSSFDITQLFFRCCGVMGYQDWFLNENATLSDQRPCFPNEPCDTNTNETFWPITCCSVINQICEGRPTEDNIYTRGCLKYELNLLYMIIGSCLSLELIVIASSCVGFFYIYVLEVLVLKVPDPHVPDPEPQPETDTDDEYT